MFTGLIEEVGHVSRVQRGATGLTVWLEAPSVAAASQPGDSIAVSGVCLTVEQIRDQALSFHVGTESLQRTTASDWGPRTPVNLERPLAVGEPMGGHFVQGHVDCVGHLRQRTVEGETVRLRFSVPAPMTAYIAEKGSIAVNGISLTVAELGPDSFSVAIIPYTLHNTNLGTLALGDAVNIEVDILAKYVRRALGERGAMAGSEITEQFLTEQGFC